MIRAGYVLAGVLALGALAGCKEGVGETCQIDADCDKDLICNLAQKVCAVPGTSGDLDAGAVPDAPIDAPTDAAADAPVVPVAPATDEAASDEARAN